MQMSMTPAEKELHRAKEALSFLNQLTAQVERGATIDFDRALQTLATTSAHLTLLSQGQLPASGEGAQAPSGNATGGFVTGGANAAGATIHARTTGSAAVTELQKRRAQQVLSELQLIETTLRRYQRKAQQAAGHSASVQQLLGRYGSAGGGSGGAATDRTDYNEMDQLEKERQSLQYTRRRMQQMNTESQAVLQALQGQTSRMGGTGDKIAHLMESIGVSNTTVLQIVRRNQVDAWLVYGGIIAFLFLMWFIWRS